MTQGFLPAGTARLFLVQLLDSFGRFRKTAVLLDFEYCSGKASRIKSHVNSVPFWSVRNDVLKHRWKEVLFWKWSAYSVVWRLVGWLNSCEQLSFTVQNGSLTWWLRKPATCGLQTIPILAQWTEPRESETCISRSVWKEHIVFDHLKRAEIAIILSVVQFFCLSTCVAIGAFSR